MNRPLSAAENRGPRVAPEMAELVATLGTDPLPLGAASADDLRQRFREMITYLNGRTPPASAIHVTESTIPGPSGGLRMRTYAPVRPARHGVILYFHGGGWVVGDLDTGAPNASRIARRMGLPVISVDYRLAPEHPFPAAFDDCLAALDATAASAQWIGVAGDSAGGNLAAAVAVARPRSVDAQLLIYPVLDPTVSSQSSQDFAEGCQLTTEQLRWYLSTYLGDGYRSTNDPRFSPLAMADVSSVPPAVIVEAGLDPLRDDARRYAANLIAAGVSTAFVAAPHFVHGWIDMAGRVPSAATLFDRAIGLLADLHAVESHEYRTHDSGARR